MAKFTENQSKPLELGIKSKEEVEDGNVSAVSTAEDQFIVEDLLEILLDEDEDCKMSPATNTENQRIAFDHVVNIEEEDRDINFSADSNCGKSSSGDEKIAENPSNAKFSFDFDSYKIEDEHSNILKALNVETHFSTLNLAVKSKEKTKDSNMQAASNTENICKALQLDKKIIEEDRVGTMTPPPNEENQCKPLQSTLQYKKGEHNKISAASKRATQRAVQNLDTKTIEEDENQSEAQNLLMKNLRTEGSNILAAFSPENQSSDVVVKLNEKDRDGIKNIVDVSQDIRQNISTKTHEIIIGTDINGMFTLGRNGTKIHMDDFEKINWDRSPSSVLRQILRCVFGTALGECSLSGKPSPAFRDLDKPKKGSMDERKVEDITEFATEVLKLSAREVRNIITIKCADEAKRLRVDQLKAKERATELLKFMETTEYVEPLDVIYTKIVQNNGR